MKVKNKKTNEEIIGFAERSFRLKNTDPTTNIYAACETELVSIDPDNETILVRHAVRERDLNGNRIVHGGVLAFLLDTTMGRLLEALICRDVTPTSSLNINYVRGVEAGKVLYCRAEVVKIGGLLGVMKGEIIVDDEVCAFATATFAILG